MILQHPDYYGKVKQRRWIFLKDLAKQMILMYIRERSTTAGLQKNILDAMALCGVQKEETRPQSGSGLTKGKRYFKCPSSKDRKTSVICSKCQMNVCMEHSSVVCYGWF